MLEINLAQENMALHDRWILVKIFGHCKKKKNY